MLSNPSQQRIEEILYHLTKLEPENLAPVLAARYTRYSYAVARQQLQALADTLSTISVAVASFVLDSDWQRRVAEAKQHLQQPDESSLLTVQDVAKRLKLTKQKVYRMIKEGQLRAIDINDHHGSKPCIRIRHSDLPA